MKRESLVFLLRNVSVFFMMILCFFTTAVQAGTIFNFQCSTATCDGNDPFLGYYEFTESSVTAGRSFGAADDILHFYFETPNDTYNLSGLINNINDIEVIFSEDRQTIVDFIVAGGPSPIEFSNATGTNRLITFVDEVSEDFPGGTPISGRWVVPAPPAAYLFASGLIWLIGISRRKKAA
jgi:hypothetical protein